jgi:hypothetical protein
MNIQEIKAAIMAGKKVCFECSSQLVVLVDDCKSILNLGLGVHHLRHDVVMLLDDEKSLDDCFIYGE